MKITWKNCLKLGVSAFILYLAIYYWGVASNLLGMAINGLATLFLGIAIAYVLNILMSFYEKHYFKKQAGKKAVEKTRRPVCLIASILTLLGIITLIVSLVVPELVKCVGFLLSEIPPFIEEVLASEWGKEYIPADIIEQLKGIDWMKLVSDAIGGITAGIGGAVNAVLSAVTSVVSVIVSIFIGIIFAIYLLYSRDKLQNQGIRLMKSYLPEKIQRKLQHVFSVFNDSFRRYIVGQCTEAVILGVLCTIGMLIFRFPYAGMIGALIGFTALIPVAGAYIGASVGAIMILTESPFKALMFLVFILVLQQLEGNLIYPKVVGKSTGLPAIWVLAAVTVGGAVFGIFGMLIGVPIAAAVYRLVRDDVRKREKAEAIMPNEEVLE